MSLTTGQRTGTLLTPIPEGGEEVGHKFEPFSEVLRCLISAHLEVLFNSERWEDVVGLGDKPDSLSDELVRAFVGDLLTAQSDGAAVDAYPSKQCLQQGGLASTVGSDDPDEFALVGVQVTAVEDVHPGDVASDDVVDADQRALGSANVLGAIHLGLDVVPRRRCVDG